MGCDFYGFNEGEMVEGGVYFVEGKRKLLQVRSYGKLEV